MFNCTTDTKLMHPTLSYVTPVGPSDRSNNMSCH